MIRCTLANVSKNCDISDMKKTNTSVNKRKSTSRIVKGRSRAALSRPIMGVTSDGIIIYEPKLSPQTFTKTELRDAVRAVKAERVLQVS